jgi:fructokinase
MQQNTDKPFAVTCFGETLWDILPGGEYIGGAPLNVAYHLRQLGIRPALISRVGSDLPGQQLIGWLEEVDMSTHYFQMDYEHGTGKVIARLDASKDAVYDIIGPVAWDYIENDVDYFSLVKETPYFLFGTLASRNPTTRRTLLQLLDYAPTKVLDLNLRIPHYSRELVTTLLEKADVLKLNQQELEGITGWFSSYRTEKDRINGLQDQFQLKHIILTRGKDGALMNVAGSYDEHNGYPVQVEDTVGSGDAFTAAILYGMINNMQPAAMLELANKLAAKITTLKGPCPVYEAADITGTLIHT